MRNNFYEDKVLNTCLSKIHDALIVYCYENNYLIFADEPSIEAWFTTKEDFGSFNGNEMEDLPNPFKYNVLGYFVYDIFPNNEEFNYDEHEYKQFMIKYIESNYKRIIEKEIDNG